MTTVIHMYNSFQNVEQKVANFLIEYCKTEEFNDFRFGSTLGNLIGASHQGTHLLQLHFNKQFAIEYLKSYSNDTFVYNFKEKNPYICVEVFNILALTQEQTLIRFDFGCRYNQSAKGVPFDKQFNVGAQKRILSKNIEIGNNEDFRQHYEYCMDACLRPQYSLQSVEDLWNYVFKNISKIMELKAAEILSIVDLKDYSSVRILKNELLTLSSMQEVLPYQYVRQQMKKDRYNLEKLRKLSHIHCLRAVMELQQLMKLHVKFSQKEEKKLNLDQKMVDIQFVNVRIGELKVLISNAKISKEQIYKRIEELV